jgi:hypothetical protein
MSTQGGTLQRRATIELPIWPVAVLVVAALAAAIGMTLLRDAGQTTFVTSVSDTERFENSSAAVREQGAVAPTISLTNSGVAIKNRGFAIPEYVSGSHVAPSLHASTGYAGFENPSATYIRESSGFAGFENPAASGAVAWGSIGGPNEALHRQYSPPQDGAASAHTWGPIMVNGEPCMQCK